MSRRKPRTGGDGLWKWTPSGIERADITNNPLRRPCPFCHVTTGTPCRSGRRVMRGYHPARQQPATERTSQ